MLARKTVLLQWSTLVLAVGIGVPVKGESAPQIAEAVAVTQASEALNVNEPAGAVSVADKGLMCLGCRDWWMESGVPGYPKMLTIYWGCDEELDDACLKGAMCQNGQGAWHTCAEGDMGGRISTVACSGYPTCGSEGCFLNPQEAAVLETEGELSEVDDDELGGGGDDLMKPEECAPLLMARLDDAASIKRMITLLPKKFRYNASYDVLEILSGCEGTDVIFSAPAPTGLREQIATEEL